MVYSISSYSTIYTDSFLFILAGPTANRTYSEVLMDYIVCFLLSFFFLTKIQKNNDIGLYVFTPISIAVGECCQKHEHTVKITAALR